MLKTIFITITTTLAAVALAANLFLNSLLGAFNLAVIPVATLAQLQASQRIVDAMKARHFRKKALVSKRFIKRAGKRVASTALAAATVGTIAVAAAMTTAEASDYCNQKAELQEQGNILFGTDNEFDLEQCIQKSTDDAKAILAEAKATVTSRISSAFDTARRYSRQIWASVKAATSNAIDYTESASTNLWNSATSWFTD